ncbi:hypothetical protein [Thermoplasma acidophilum]|uniref:hypothetical protein n=1 Tax=Thermoplasma acidophilum TaxID=2303 RepID=UPI00064EB0D8|nr:hypothetical protein [Thermoplasma acidophilum]
MRSELIIEDADCERFLMTIKPDNFGGITAECNNGNVKIKIEEKKYGTIFTLMDDIIRSYEVFEKIRKIIPDITALR